MTLITETPKCLCGAKKEEHASGPGFSFTYCQKTSCEGFEEAEDIQEELTFDEED